VAESIFLSHWHEDAAEAIRLKGELEDAMRAAERKVHVFCTASPGDRFPDMEDRARIEEDLRRQLRAWTDELRAYLRKHVDAASAYLLLITARGMARHSVAVGWEIEEGAKLARERAVPFVPCLLDVGYEALGMRTRSRPSRWQEWEFGPSNEGAPERDFQAIPIDGHDGVQRLVDVLLDSLMRHRV